MRRAPIAVTLAGATLLIGAAVFTVNQADCDDAGYYVQRDGGYELVGGCLEPGDLPVGPAPDGGSNLEAPNPRP
jgi:hypothetical protein